MQSKLIALCAPLIFGVACNISDPEANNANTNNRDDNNVIADMNVTLDMAPDQAQPADMASDLGEPQDMEADQPDAMIEDMAPDMSVGPDTIPIDELKEEYLKVLSQTYCSLVWSCAHPPPSMLSELGGTQDLDSCTKHPQFELGFGRNIDQIIEAVDAGRIAYDAEAAARCIRPLQEQISDPKFCDSPALFEGESPDCELVFRGLVAQDKPCIESNECASPPGGLDVYCERTGAVCYGTCKVSTNNNLCGGVTCQDNEFCLYDAQDARCKAKSALGEGCQSSDGCLGERTFCAFSSRGAGVCVEANGTAIGQSCIESSQCFSGAICADGACAYPQLQGEGQSCGDERNVCKPGLVCALIDPINSKRECKQPADGASCYAHRECPYDRQCDGFDSNANPPKAGACKERKDDGQSCGSSNECKSFNCDTDLTGLRVCMTQAACNLPSN